MTDSSARNRRHSLNLWLIARLRLLGVALVVACLFGLVRGTEEIVAQQYLAIGLYRNAALVLSQTLSHIMALCLAAVAAVLILERILHSLVGGEHSWPLALGGGAALAVLLRLGWVWNRYEFAPAWRDKVIWHGLRLRRGLFELEVWGVNLLIITGTVLGGLVLYLLLRSLQRWWLRSRWPLCKSVRELLGRPALVPALAVIPVLFWLVVALSPTILFGDRVPRGPNVILISLDTLRGDRLGCHGYNRNTSPAIDLLAAQSTLFLNCYSQAPNTFPSHASLFTSMYPCVNRASLQGHKLARWRTTIAEIFREAGYRTSGIVDAGFLTGQFGMAQGYDDFVGWGRRIRNIKPKAIDWLRRHGDRPFFLLVHCYDIHAPYAVLPEYQAMFHEFEYSWWIDPAEHHLDTYMWHLFEGKEPPFGITAADVRHISALYDGGIRYTDDQLAGLLGFLRDDGFLENSIVAVISDHGETFMEHGNVLHADLYRPATRVPFILRLPASERAGRVVEEPVGLIDLLPTLLDLTGVISPVPLEGQTLLPLINGNLDSAPQYVFSEFEQYGGWRGIYWGRYHYVNRLELDSQEIFDVQTDPLEQVNLVDELPEVLLAFREVEEDWLERQRALIRSEAGQAIEEIELDPRTREDLRALGYIR